MTPRHQDRYTAALERALRVYEDELRDLRRRVADQAAALSVLTTAKHERDAIAQSTFWRMTRPLRILADLVRGHYSLHSNPASSEPATNSLPDWERVLARGLAAADRSLNALRADRSLTFATYPEPGPSGQSRITLVLTDLCDVRDHRDALIAFVLAATLAEEADARLRVLTRDVATDPVVLTIALAAHGVDVCADIEFDGVSPTKEAYLVGVLDTEQFVTPAGAMAAALLEAVSPARLCVVATQRPADLLGGDNDAWRRLFGHSEPRYVFHCQSMVENLEAQGMLPVRHHVSVVDVPKELPTTAEGWCQVMRSVTPQIALP